MFVIQALQGSNVQEVQAQISKFSCFDSRRRFPEHPSDEPTGKTKQFPGRCNLGIVLRLAIERLPSVDPTFGLWPRTRNVSSESARENVGRT